MRRRFHLVDGMILVAATGAGLAWTRFNLDVSGPIHARFSTPKTLAPKIADGIAVGLIGFQPILLAWTYALLVIRLRSPRPPLRAVSRQPGFVACAAAGLAVALTSVRLVEPVLSGHGEIAVRWFLVFYSAEPAFAVLGACLALALGRRWRPERSWIDRAGRAVGFAWFLANALLAARNVLDAL